MSCTNMRENVCGATGVCGLFSLSNTILRFYDVTEKIQQPENLIPELCPRVHVQEQLISPCRDTGLQQVTGGNYTRNKQQ